MRRRKRRRELHSVSLFPFLAVLICTFGVLIILLVIVVKAADTQASVASNEEAETHEQQINELNLALDFQKIRIDGLKAARPDLLAKLGQQKDRQAFLQAEISKAVEELELIENSLAYDGGVTLDQSRLALQNELDLLVQQLADERDLLELKKESLVRKSEQTKYSVVPYAGSQGIERRPIYIECRDNSIELQPYGIRLSPSDFVDPILPNNPLDAALVAIREYYLKNDLLKDDEAPYPLLIVRPDGAVSYSIARHAIKSWDEEFGYELIDHEVELEFGASDDQLANQIKLAVDAARRRQSKYVAQKKNYQQRFDKQVKRTGGLHASGSFGGFVSSNGRPESQAKSTHQLASFEKDPDAEAGNQISKAQQNADIAFRGVKSSSSLAKERGKGWALPSSAEGSTAYHRPVTVYLSNEAVILNPDSNGSRRQKIEFHGDLVSEIDRLVEAVRLRIDSWGVAGLRAHWQPTLDVKVIPGAEAKYREIENLLRDSGLKLKESRP